MKSKYKPYPSYRDSGVEWLNEVPKEWNSSSLKFQLNNLDFRRIPISASERGDIQGHYPYYGASGIIDYVEDYIFSEKTILIGEDGANLLSKSTPLAFIADGKYWVNNHAHILKPKDDLYNFWSYTLNSLDLTSVISGSAQPKLTAEALGNLFVVFPTSLTERQAISNYLDSATAKIDTLIEKQIELIALLKEKRQAVISTAVTRGLDNTVVMKASGVEWLGEIPDGWKTSPLKYLGKFINGYAFNSSSFVEKGIKILKITNIQHMVIKWDDTSYVDESFYDSLPLFRVYKNDLVFALTRPIISTGIKVSLILDDEKILINQRNSIFRATKIETSYIYYILLNKLFIHEFEGRIDKTGQQPNISHIDIGKITVPLPDEKEQKKIVDYLNYKTSRIDTLITKAIKAIDLLKEKRTAIISSAVTGKIDVREIA